ncbi:hypothetical protein ACTHRH_16895 [Paenibacillus sp. SAFN-117]
MHLFFRVLEILAQLKVKVHLFFHVWKVASIKGKNALIPGKNAKSGHIKSIFTFFQLEGDLPKYHLASSGVSVIATIR